jgi:hypothetical protein
MGVGIFSLMILSLVLSLALLNGFWLSRLFKAEWRRMFRWSYAGLTLLSAAAYLGVRVTGQFDGPGSLSLLFYFGPFWTVLQLLLLVAWPFSKLIGLMQKLWQRYKPANQQRQADGLPVSPLNPAMTRRVFISRAALAPPIAMTGINAIGLVDAEACSVLRRLDLAYEGLPNGLAGFKIGHMTDAHIGSYVSVKDIQKMGLLLQQESPDLLAITGDLVDDVNLLPAAMEALQPLMSQVRLGTWFCMGNHEHIRGAAPIRRILQQYGVNILDNRHQRISTGSASLFVAGVDYPMNVNATARRVTALDYLEDACRGIPAAEFTLLLAHHPDFLPGAFARNVRLTLAGHTHGGQVGWGSRSAFEFIYPYMRGIYHEGGNLAYVSSGAGHWLPFRLNCPPEVSLITLKPKA